MILCRIDNKKRKLNFIHANGNNTDLVTEICTLISMCFMNIRKQNPEAAKEFKVRLIAVLLDPTSPVWETDNNNT